MGNSSAAPRGISEPGAAKLPLAHRDKEVGTHDNAHTDDNAPHLPRVRLLREMGAEPSSNERTCDHHGTLRPQHRARQSSKFMHWPLGRRQWYVTTPSCELIHDVKFSYWQTRNGRFSRAALDRPAGAAAFVGCSGSGCNVTLAMWDPIAVRSPVEL